MNTGQLIAFVVAVGLLGLSFYYAKQKKYKRSAIVSCFWLAPLLMAYSIGKELRIEQWIFWSAAAASLHYSHRLLKDNHLG